MHHWNPEFTTVCLSNDHCWRKQEKRMVPFVQFCCHLLNWLYNEKKTISLLLKQLSLAVGVKQHLWYHALSPCRDFPGTLVRYFFTTGFAPESWLL
jgi:hypothetical protein